MVEIRHTGRPASLDIYAELRAYLVTLPADRRSHFVAKAQGAEQGNWRGSPRAGLRSAARFGPGSRGTPPDISSSPASLDPASPRSSATSSSTQRRNCANS